MARLMKWGLNRGDVTERLFWRLSKSPALHSELVGKFGDVIKRIMPAMLRAHVSFDITAGNWFQNEKGERDRLYTLRRLEVGKYNGLRNRSIKQAVEINNHKPSESLRQIRTRQAKLRAKLIATGEYNEEVEKKICGNS